MVALGYSQVPGIDFTENFAPIVIDVTFRIALTRMIVKNLDSMLMHMESAFLCGELGEKIYMEVPVGLKKSTQIQSMKKILVSYWTREFMDENFSRNEQT